MKKSLILLLSIIALLFTFILSNLFSIYRLGSTPTLLTSLYLINIFVIFDYLLIFTTYIIKKLVRKEKLDINRIMAYILLLVSLSLILSFVIITYIDYLTRYEPTKPFYWNVIKRIIEFLLPSIITFIISVILLKRKKERTSYEKSIINLCILFNMSKWLH